MSGVPQGSILRPMLFNIFINDIDSGIEYILRKFVGDTNLCGAVNSPEGWDVIQRDLDRLEQWAQVRFNKSKCGVLYFSCGNPYYQYELANAKPF